MTWTNVPKPTDSTYTYVNPQGKQTYDQADILFDDPSVFYDSVDQSAYTKIPKPTGESIVITSGGASMGLLIPLTSSTSSIITVSAYTKIPKPIT